MVKAIWAVACSVLVLGSYTTPLVLPAFAEGTAGLTGTAAGVPAKGQSSTPAGAAVLFSTGAPSDPSYRLGPEDQLRISVWDNKELTLDLVVRPDGKISMPLIQDVLAEGLTAAQLASSIREKLAAFIVNPDVSVIVLQVNSPKYYIIGYVTRPGTYPLRGEMSVLQALALAGGLTHFASPRSIKLIRAANGRQEVRTINYFKLIEDGGEGNYLLKPGDTIAVP